MPTTRDRLASGIALTACASLLLLAGRPGHVVLLLAFVIAAAREFCTLVRPSTPPALLQALCACVAAAGAVDALAAAYGAALFAVSAYHMAAAASVSLDALAKDVFCLVWVPVPLSLALYLPVHAVVFTLACVHNGENGALLCGKLVGGDWHPELSPKKTVAGFVGQLVASVAQAVLLSTLGYGCCASTLGDAALGAALAATAIHGDLLASYVKRAHGVKDFGGALPGMGGVLDRIDGLLPSFPLVVWVLTPWTNSK